MIFTNCGKLGDMFLCLPVLSHYSKVHDKRVAFAISTHFPYAREAEELLNMQQCISDVLYFDYGDGVHDNRTADNLGKYHIKPDVFKGTLYEGDEIISLGFHKWPNKYLPEFYAEEYGLGVDYDFKLNYGAPDYTLKDLVVKVDKYEQPQLQHVDGTLLAADNGMVKNLQLAAVAKEVITWTTGFSVMATLARIPVTIYQPASLIEHHKMYFNINGGIKEVYV